MFIAIAALLFQIAPTAAAVSPLSFIAGDPSDPAPVIVSANLPKMAASTESIFKQPLLPNSRTTERPSTAPRSVGNVTENLESVSSVRVSDTSHKPSRFVGPKTLPSGRRWIALLVAQHTAAAFDAYTTRNAIARGAIEEDPLMRPFANSSGLYAAIQVAPLALDFAARRMQRSRNSFLRRMWWVPQSFGTGMYLFSGVRNIQVAGEQ